MPKCLGAPLPVRCAMHGTIHCKGGTSIYVLCYVMPSRLSRAYPVYNSAILPQIINHRALVYVPVRPTSGSHTAQATARTRSRFSWVTVAVWAAQVADEVALVVDVEVAVEVELVDGVVVEEVDNEVVAVVVGDEVELVVAACHHMNNMIGATRATL